MPPIKYPFPEVSEETGYRLFPADLENDANVFFHGTDAINGQKILKEGFAIPKAGPVLSNSFSSTSDLALCYACSKRSLNSPEGCVIAVRFDDLMRKGISHEGSVLYMYAGGPQPDIIGLCPVPSFYRHI